MIGEASGAGPVNDGANTTLASKVVIPGLEQAQARSTEAVVEAEKFRASIEKPTGMNISENQLVDMMHTAKFHGQLSDDQIAHGPIAMGGVSDDNFFHVTSHIEPNLQMKIEDGQFVDLDKLLPKDRMTCFDARGNFSDDNKFEWVQRDGGTYLMPARKTSRITGFSKWEQAF